MVANYFLAVDKTSVRACVTPSTIPCAVRLCLLSTDTMPGKMTKYWMCTTTDNTVKPVVNDKVVYYQAQPENVTHWHQHIYAEFAERVGMRECMDALGMKKTSKGSKVGYSYRAEPRRGTKAQAQMYCASKWFCGTCHVGDAKELQQDGKFGDVEYDAECDTKCRIANGPWKDHSECPGYKLKGKIGEVQILGTPVEEGRGGKREGSICDQREQVLATIKAGKPRQYVLETYGAYCQQFMNYVNQQFTLAAPVRRWMPHVYWLHGDAGCDKSRMARAVLAKSCYCKPPDSKWFDGYDGQEVLILNDLRKSTFTFSYLLDLLDRYEFRVEVKNGYAPMLAKVIVVTCSKSHAELWAELGGTTNENLGQLTRRIKHEMDVGNATDNDKKRMVERMRMSILTLRDECNWDVEDKYGEWDGEEQAPAISDPNRLKEADESATTTAHRCKRPKLFGEGMSSTEMGNEDGHVPPRAKWPSNVVYEFGEEQQDEEDYKSAASSSQ